ncbi:MAG: hypothetical protein ACRCZQ_01955 [Bacteroidales bacterium]
MQKEKYVSPLIVLEELELEQAIAGSIPVGPGDSEDSFREAWMEETIFTGDIEIL